MKAEDLLKRLLDNFYTDSDGHVQWSWREGVSIHEQDMKLEAELLEWCDENNIVIK